MCALWVLFGKWDATSGASAVGQCGDEQGGLQFGVFCGNLWAKCGMLDCLWGDLNGKKQQHSVDSKVSSSWREQFGFVYGRS